MVGRSLVFNSLCANVCSPWLNMNLLHLLFVLGMYPFLSQTQEENQSPQTLPPHTLSPGTITGGNLGFSTGTMV